MNLPKNECVSTGVQTMTLVEWLDTLNEKENQLTASGNTNIIGAFADWLEERGDTRSNLVRTFSFPFIAAAYMTMDETTQQSFERLLQTTNEINAFTRAGWERLPLRARK